MTKRPSTGGMTEQVDAKVALRLAAIKNRNGPGNTDIVARITGAILMVFTAVWMAGLLPAPAKEHVHVTFNESKIAFMLDQVVHYYPFIIFIVGLVLLKKSALTFLIDTGALVWAKIRNKKTT